MSTLTALARSAMLPGMPDEQHQAALERAVVGGLRSAIHAHGPIGPENIGSAAKRIVKNLVNAKLGALASVMGQKRWSGLSAEERAELARAGGKKGGSLGGRTAWAGMSKAERSQEMRRRAAVRSKAR